MALWKKSKLGHVPGDITIQHKAQLLAGTDPKQQRSARCLKTYKQDHVKRTNRRIRRLSVRHELGSYLLEKAAL